MARQLRIEYPGATYHVMSRGVARMNTFVDDQDRMRFLELVGEAAKAGALIVHAYCLMPNHYHLLAETPEAQLGRWMQQILGVYASGFNRRHKRVGHLWQGRYKAILVEEGEYFLECSRYIHLNPNRSGSGPCPNGPGSDGARRPALPAPRPADEPPSRALPSPVRRPPRGRLGFGFPGGLLVGASCPDHQSSQILSQTGV